MTNGVVEPANERGRGLSAVRVWVMASRPRTLSLSLSPVIVGVAFGWADAGWVRWMATFVAALAAALIQIGTNLYNDSADSRRGGDGAARIGPPRVTASGLVDAGRVGKAAALSFAGAAAAGLYLAIVGGWPIIAIGIASIVCGWAYSEGPAPIAYTPFGEVFVLGFFGIVAVMGTAWLASGVVGPAGLLAGISLGLFASAVLLVNNHRDRLEDARVGRRTLAILIGTEWTHLVYALLMLAPFMLLAPMSRLLPHSHVEAAVLVFPVAVFAAARFWKEPPGRGLNELLALTAQVQLAFAILLSLGAVA